MWKCPNCQTDNQNNFCKTCGQPKEAQPQTSNSPNFSEQNANTQIPRFDKPGYPLKHAVQAQHDSSNYSNNQKPPKNNHTVLIAICIILAMVLSGFVGVGAYLMINKDDIKADETVQLTDKVTENDKSQPPDNDDVPMDVVEVVEESDVSNEVVEDSDAEEEPLEIEETPTETGYKMYTDSQYSFVCAYPASFHDITATGVNALKAFESPDSTATMTIRVAKDPGNITIADAIAEYKAAYYGEVTYEASGDTWYAVSIDSGSVLRYRKFFMEMGNLYCMDFSFYESDLDIYAPYVEYIEDNFHVIE